MTQNTNEAPKKKGNAKRGWLIAIAVIAIIVATVSIWWYGDQKAPDIAGSESENSEKAEEVPDEAINIVHSSDREVGRYYTMLVVGYDAIGANTDTMMVARFDAVEKKLNIVSIPRDTLANVSWPDKKINSIYLATGESIDGLKSGIEDILGFEVDSYAFVDVSAFEKIVDCIGGLYFDVPCDMHYDDPIQGLSINIDKGYQWLSGENALKVCRYRWSYPMADIDRIGVQQDFLKAAIPQIISLGNALKAPELTNIVLDNLKTDLTFGNIKWYVNQLLSMDTEDISFMMLPANTCCSINGVSYVSITVDDWMEMVNKYFNPFNTKIKPGNCNILYQIAAEPSAHTITPSNYVVTNGTPVAGGLSSFQKYG